MPEAEPEFNPYAPPQTTTGVADVAHKFYVIENGELWVKPGFQGPRYDMATGLACGPECVPSTRKFTHSLSIVEYINPSGMPRKRLRNIISTLLFVASLMVILLLANVFLGVLLFLVGFAISLFQPGTKIRAVGIRPPYFKLKGVHQNYLMALEAFYKSR